MKVFISGTAGFNRKFTNPSLEESKINLPDEVKTLIDKHVADNNEILVGDCIGIDLLVQEYLRNKNYKNVTVYHSGKKYRNCIDSDWNIKSVNVPYGITGREFFAVKDKQMAIDADTAIAIWDGKSIGTGNNIKNMQNMNKPVTIYRIDKQPEKHEPVRSPNCFECEKDSDDYSNNIF